MMTRTTRLAAVALVGGLAAIALSGAVSAKDSPVLAAKDDEITVTSLPASDLWDLQVGEIRAAKLDGELHLAGVTSAQGTALAAAVERSCTVGTQLGQERSGDAEAVAKLTDALGKLGCDVSVYDLVVTESGLSGIVATTDATNVAPLQQSLGEGVRVEVDHAGTSPGPGA